MIDARIQDLNQSLSGLYDGRVTKAKAQLDASVAAQMRKDLDELVEGTTGEAFQSVKNEYGALKTIEKDVARQAYLEARKAKAGLIDLPDIFTGGDLMAGVVTANPALIIKGAVGQGVQKYFKYINNPNLYIKRAFEVLDQAANVPEGSSIISRNVPKGVINYAKNPKIGLGIEDVSKRPGFVPPNDPKAPTVSK